MGKLTVSVESGNSDSENADVESEEASEEEEPSEEELDEDESQEVYSHEEPVEESCGPNEETSCKPEVDEVASCKVDPGEEDSSEESNEQVSHELEPNEVGSCGSPREEACSGKQDDESSEEEQDATNEEPCGEDVEGSSEEAEPSEEEPDNEEPIEEETDEEPDEEELEEELEEEPEEEEQSEDPDEEPSEGEPSGGSLVHQSCNKNNCNSQANLGKMNMPSDIASEPKGVAELSGIMNSSNNKLVPEKLANARITGGKRRSRWDVADEAKELAQDGGGTTAEKGKTPGPKGSKVKKTRWSRWSNDASQFSTAATLKNPAVEIDPEISMLQVQIFQITNKLQSRVVDDRPESERSPSPPPIYDNLGIRINTREARLRSKLRKERQAIISELIKKNPNYKPPSYYKNCKLHKRIKIPSKEYPGYNFVGLILGPRGNTQKKMMEETGARIAIRGKGSILEGKSRQDKSDPSDYEDTHVLVEADDQYSLDAAVAMVKKLLVPVDDGHNEHKLAQLRELAKLNGTFRDTDTSSFRMPDPCSVCGNVKHSTSTCPLTAPAASGPSSNSYQVNFFSEIGGGISPFSGPSHPVAAISPAVNATTPANKPKKEIDDAKLFVGQLPQFVDESKLSELFGVFGRLCETKVIKDRGTGLSKGYGFVKYTDHVNAANAVAKMNGYKIEGKMLSVRIAGIGQPSVNQLPTYPGLPNVPQKTPNPMHWPGPPESRLPETVPSLNQLPTYPGPPNIPQKTPNPMHWPGPPESRLPETVPSVNQLPTYSGPPNVPPRTPDPMHWSGPPESRLPETVPSFSNTSSLPVYDTPFNRQYSASVAPSYASPAAASLFTGDFVTSDDLAHFPGYLKSLDPPAQSYNQSKPSGSFSSSSQGHFSQNYGDYRMPPTK